MRVLHLTAGNIYGGVERTLETIALHNGATGRIESEFALCYRGRIGKNLESVGATLHYLGEARTSRPWTVLRARSALKAVLRERKIDLVVTHASWPHAIFSDVAKSCRVPVVLWLHAAFTGKQWLERWAARSKPDAIICNSEYTRSSSRLPFQNLRMEVIYNAVRHQAILTSDRRPDPLITRRQLGVNSGELVVTQIARIERLKGHRLLLSSLALLPPEVRWVCWIAGGPGTHRDAQLLGSLKERATSLGIGERVRFLGERSDVDHLLAASDVFCMPNVEPDSFGNSVIEALYHGVPVVATEMGGPAEILAGGNGVLVPPNDPQAMANAIARFAIDPAAAAVFRMRGPARALELCDVRIQLMKFADFFESVIEQREHNGRKSL